MSNRGKMVYVKAKKTLPHQGGHWSETKKQKAVCLWVAGIPLTQIAVELNVPHETIKGWRTTTWWNDIAKDLRSEESQKLDAKLTKILDKSLENIMDRLENGEFIYDQKTGKVKRAPTKLRDSTVAFNTLMDKRSLIRKEPTKIVEQQSTAQQLENLAKQFEQFVTGKIKEEKLKDVVAEFIIDDTVQQDEDGTYYVKDTDDALHDQRETRLQERAELGAHEEEISCEGPGTQEQGKSDGS